MSTLKITPAIKAEIEAALKEGASGSELAKKYGVAPSSISRIKSAMGSAPITVAPVKKIAKSVKNASASSNMKEIVNKSKKVPKAVKSVEEQVEPKAIPVQKYKRKFIIYSNKLRGKKHSSNAETLGELFIELNMKEGGLEAIFPEINSKTKVSLSKKTDKLPDIFDEPIIMYLTLLKSDAGK